VTDCRQKPHSEHADELEGSVPLGVEHGEETDLRTEMFWDHQRPHGAWLRWPVIAGYRWPLVLQCGRGQFLRQGEDHMKIADAEQLLGVSAEPLVAGVGWAPGAVPVATREERDGAMAAPGALIEMTAERCCAEVLDGL